MKGRYLDPRELPRQRSRQQRSRRRRKRLLLALALSAGILGGLWALGWIHPAVWGCLTGAAAGRICYLMGKEDGYDF